MAKIVVTIPAQEYEYDLEGYEEDFFVDGEWDMDGLYDGFVHDAITHIKYDWDVNDVLPEVQQD